MFTLSWIGSNESSLSIPFHQFWRRDEADTFKFNCGNRLVSHNALVIHRKSLLLIIFRIVCLCRARERYVRSVWIALFFRVFSNFHFSLITHKTLRQQSESVRARAPPNNVENHFFANFLSSLCLELNRRTVQQHKSNSIKMVTAEDHWKSAHFQFLYFYESISCCVLIVSLALPKRQKLELRCYWTSQPLFHWFSSLTAH